MGKFAIIFSLIFLVSCSPVRLVNRAIKKDPEVLNPFILDRIPEGDTNCMEILLEPRISYPQPTPLANLISNMSDNRTERVRLRQEGRTQRRESRENQANVAQEEKSNRTESRQEGSTERTTVRQEGSTNRTESRQTERTNRTRARFNFLWGSLCVVAFLTGLVLGYNRGKRYDRKMD